MFKNPRIATIILNLYIIVFIVVLQVNISQRLEHILLHLAPLVSLWMFYALISSPRVIRLEKK